MDMQSLWRRLYEAIAPGRRSPRRRPRPPAPALRIMRLERRRVLSADFSFGAGGLILEGFDAGGGETLTIDQAETEYRFTLDHGQWSNPASSMPDGVRIDGQTLAIESSVLDQLENGLTVIGDAMTPLGVSLGEADFSGLDGPLTFTGIRSLNQVANTQFAFGDASGLEVSAAENGMTIGSINVAGDLTILSFGPIVDGDGTEINVTGNATFISRAFAPDADFDADGVVGTSDYGIWTSYFGLGAGATKAQGDADGNGAVDLADYTVWRDTLGQVSEPGGIILADNATDILNVGGVATFEAQDGPARYDIDVGSMGTTNFGSLAVIGANASIQEDSSTELVEVDAAAFTLTSDGAITDAPGTTIDVTGLATFDAGANPITLGDDAGDTTNFGQLGLTGGAVSVTEDSSTELTDVTAGSFTLTSAGAITDASNISIAGNATFIAGGSITMNENAGDIFSIGGLATFRAGAIAPFFDITIGPAGMANFGSLHLTGDDVSVQEDSATVLTHVTATTLSLTSDGSITDAAATTIGVSGLATFNAGANPITLGDSVGDTTNFGQLHVTGGAVAVTEDSGTELTGVSAASLHLISAGPITDAPGTTISVTGLARIAAGANPITLGDNAADTTNFGQLNVTGGAVAVTEDSGTELTGVTATSLTLTSAGPITDAAATTISVTGLATINAGANLITLGDSVGDTTNFGQLHLTGGAVTITEDSGTELTGVSATTLTLTSAGPITDASGTTISVTGLATLNAGANPITFGDNAADTTNFGQLNVTGGAVSITEDSGTELTGVTAASLSLTSAGAITDAAGTTISVTGLATLNAGANAITLGDNAADTTNFGQLHLTGGAVAITEDSASVLTGVTATTLNLTSAGSITDAAGTTINVTGLATLNAGANAITLGDNAADTTNFGQLHLTGGAVSITEDSATVLTGVTATTLSLTSAGSITDAAGTTIGVTGLATLNAGANPITLGDNAADVTNFGQLHLTGGAVAITEDSGTELTGVTATTLALTSAGAITDAPGTTISVTGLATLNVGANPITLGDSVGDTTNFGQLHLTGGAVAITEDSGTELTGVTAASLNLRSAGAITDVAATTISVTGLATLNAGANPITLGDNAADTTNFGQLNVTGGAVSIMEDSGTELTGVNAASLSLTSAGAITDAAGTTISVTGLATLNAGANAITLGDNAADTTNFGQLNLTGGAISIMEDSGTELTGVTAATLNLTSAGPITDAAGTTISVTGLATLNAGANAITLGDSATDTTNFGQLHLTGGAVTITEDSATVLTHVTASSLNLVSAGSITDAAGTTINVTGLATLNAGANAITLGDNVADTTNFGQLNVTGGAVAITEDSGTVLTGVTAATFHLISAGPITDAPATTISVTGLATLNAGANSITLGDSVGDTTNFGQLHLTGGTIAITEDSATVLTHVTASSLTLISAGSITDVPGTTISVTGLATFNAGTNAITLGDDAADVTNFGQLHLTGGAVAVTEDSSTELASVSAASFSLTSAGAITDSALAVIFVDGPATLIADGKITLADMGSVNSVIVVGLGSFQVSDGNDIDIGVVPATGLPAAANAQLGSLQFTAIGGMVRVALDGPIILSGSGSNANNAELTTTNGSGGEVVLNDLGLTGYLQVESDASIVDDPQSHVQVAGLAALTARSFVTLADQSSDNRFLVGGHASFHSNEGQPIDLGVVPIADPKSLSRGAAADAKLTLGSMSFVTDEGNVTANLDNSVVLANMSLAGSAWIQSFGSLTDAFGANTTITQFAILKAAAGADIVLGDDSVPGDTRFRMDTAVPTLEVFDANRFLALQAEDVSIQADSGFNLRTGAIDSAFAGTVFLQAAGNISQVGHEGVIEPLEANWIAMISAAAVLFSQARVNSTVTADDSTAPNLAIVAGSSQPFSKLVARPAGEFPIDLIPSSTITDFSPIGFNPPGVEQPRDDGSGLNDLSGARIMEPSAIGNGYSIIMKVLGDAKIGVVEDATGTQADAVGMSVSDPAGNAYVQTIADAGGGDGPGPAEVGNLVFSSLGAPTETIVRMLGGVVTAIAAGRLSIDTDQPGEATGLRTTKLTSSTGTVTSVDSFTTFDGRTPNTPAINVGPRMILDGPSENQDAATTGLVFSPEFEQRVTLVAGSRGEDNLILELEWADVQTPRDGGPALPADVPGTIPFPEVTLVPESVDGQPPQPYLQSSLVPLDFRAVTVKHNYSEAFIPSNPALPQLPTNIRLYNDPAINLFDQGGAQDLNVNDNFVSPRAVAVPTAGYFEITSAEPPTVFDPVEPIVTSVVATAPQARAVVDEIRVATSSGVETILYGRVGEDGEFVNEPGEEWPVEWQGGRDGDFLNEIRDAVENSPSLEGLYRIESRTPRGEQPLEEWVKEDAEQETDQNAEEEEATDSTDEQPQNEEAIEPEDMPNAQLAPPVPSRAEDALSSVMEDTAERGSSHLVTGQMLVGAAALVASRRNSRAIETGPNEQEEGPADLSRSARRRRAWRRRALAASGSEVAG